MPCPCCRPSRWPTRRCSPGASASGAPAGLAAFGLHAVQPWLAFNGSALRPRDLLPASAPGRLGRQSRRTWRALAGFNWTSDETTTREVDAKRPEYEALLAGGLEPFFEPARADCPLCGATDLHELVRVGDLLQGKPGTFRLDECRACRHVFQNPRLSLEGLDFYYRDFYDGLGTRSAELLFASTDTSYRGPPAWSGDTPCPAAGSTWAAVTATSRSSRPTSGPTPPSTCST